MMTSLVLTAMMMVMLNGWLDVMMHKRCHGTRCSLTCLSCKQNVMRRINNSSKLSQFLTGQVDKPEEYQLQLVEYEIIEGAPSFVNLLWKFCKCHVANVLTQKIYFEESLDVARVLFKINSKAKKTDCSMWFYDAQGKVASNPEGKKWRNPPIAWSRLEHVAVNKCETIRLK